MNEIRIWLFWILNLWRYSLNIVFILKFSQDYIHHSGSSHTHIFSPGVLKNFAISIMQIRRERNMFKPLQFFFELTDKFIHRKYMWRKNKNVSLYKSCQKCHKCTFLWLMHKRHQLQICITNRVKSPYGQNSTMITLGLRLSLCKKKVITKCAFRESHIISHTYRLMNWSVSIVHIYKDYI